eukprot:11115417-Heterocapsa_arctica.AAC.1
MDGGTTRFDPSVLPPALLPMGPRGDRLDSCQMTIVVHQDCQTPRRRALDPPFPPFLACCFSVMRAGVQWPR